MSILALTQMAPPFLMQAIDVVVSLYQEQRGHTVVDPYQL